LKLVFAAQAQQNTVLQGLREIEGKTCVRFVQRTNQADYVEIYNGAGCSSYLGRLGGKQQLSLARNGCVYKGTAMHEFIHALGYTHMQSHIDRDRFIRIQLENVQSAYRNQFDKVRTSVYGNFDTPFDYLSVMHYGRTAFSMNGRDTIVTLDRNYQNRIGSNELSSGDVARIRNMYQCR
jgi:Astacin (Peptidase family M12A)